MNREEISGKSYIHIKFQYMVNEAFWPHRDCYGRRHVETKSENGAVVTMCQENFLVCIGKSYSLVFVIYKTEKQVFFFVFIHF